MSVEQPSVATWIETVIKDGEANFCILAPQQQPSRPLPHHFYRAIVPYITDVCSWVCNGQK